MRTSILSRILRDLARVLGTAGALAAVGCSGGQDKFQKELDSLQEQVVRMQGEQDRMSERLVAMEAIGASPAAQVKKRADGESDEAGFEERPRLKVVQMAPDADAAPADESESVALPQQVDEDAKRPKIELNGTKAKKRRSKSGS